MKINTKLLLAFVIIALIPLGVISILSYFNAKDAITRQVLSHLESVAEIQGNRVESIVDQNLERLKLVSSRTQLRLSLDSFINNPNTDDQDKINQILLDARSSVSSFRDISVLTLDGEVVASTNTTKIGGTHLTDEVFIRGQNENTADIFFLDENQDLCVYLSGPLYLEDKLLGVVVIESTGDSILAAITDYTGLGTTGETQLAETDENGDALFITPTRFDQGAALSRIVPKEEINSPIIQALLQSEELFTDAVDDRGEPVLAATQYISETGWGLVTKIDKAEALASVSRLQFLLPMIVLLSLALVLLVSFFLSRAITRPIIKLVNMATKVSEGDLSIRAEVTSRDEIGILAQACNQMKDSLIKTNSELAQELAERKQAEEAVKAERQRFYDVLETLPAYLVLLTPDYHVPFANRFFRERFGESHGKRCFEYLFGRTEPCEVCETYKVLETMKPLEWEWLGPDGRNYYIYDFPFTDTDGSTLILEMGIDITERKNAEDALRESKERIVHLNSLLRALRNVNQLITRESDKERLIQKSCDILVRTRGYEKAWILMVDEDKNPMSVAGAGLGEESSVFIEQMRTGKYPSCVKQLWTQENPLLAYKNPGVQHKNCILADRHSSRGVYRCRLEYEGKVYGMLGVTVPSHALSDKKEKDLFLELCSDISFALAAIERREEHERAEEALRTSEEKLRLMFESITDGITVSDQDLKIIQLNEAVVRMHGYSSKEELVGRNALELIAKGDHARAMENAKRTLENGSVSNIEYTFLTKDAREFPAELSTAILKDGSGNPIGFIGISKDISERKQMEKQLVLTDRLASIGELAAGIAHELNNPLTGVIGFSQLLMSKEMPKDIKDDVEVVYNEAQRTSQVVKNLLTFARKHSAVKDKVNINDVINKVLELRSYEQNLENITVDARLEPELPKVMGDYFQLQQVFLNIVINAEYFMKEAHHKGKLTITTEKVGNKIRVSFADDGPGIAKDDLGHLFDPFFTTKEVGKGTGLGLSICHGIVTEHGGRIYVKSKLRKGATFIVELPVGAAERKEGAA